MAQLTVRPIVAWPGAETKAPVHSPFKASYSTTLQLLERELNQLAAKHPVLEMWVTDRDVRLDGAVRADARPSKPGVVLSFDSKHGPLRYSCDRFWDWQDNLRAIALGLEALRRVERYGIATRAEQYAGWKALPAGIALPERTGFTTLEQAAAYIAEHAGDGWNAGDLMWEPGRPHTSSVEHAYKLAAKQLHPDAGGTTEQFQLLNDAKRLLDGATP